MEVSSSQSSSRIRITVAVFTVIFCLFTAFYNLNSPSIRVSDENAHVRAAQSIIEGAEVWRPLFNGKYYINKPPFKIALSTLPALILGQSNMAFRIIDAFCGLATGLCIAWLTWFICKSTLTACFAVIILFSSPGFVFNHGIRHGVQDSMLVFLTTCFLCIFFRSLSESREKESFPAIICGILAGLAILTKSAGGLIGPVIAVSFILLSPERIQLIIRFWKQLVIGALIAASMAASYYIPLFLYTPGAYESIFGHQVLNRVTSDMGYGSSYLYYLKRIIVRSDAAPPLLLIPASLFILYTCFTNREKRTALFLLSWSAVPVVLYSFVSTRYSWYITPAYPAMAVAVAFFSCLIIRLLKDKNFFRVGFILILVLATGTQTVTVASRVLLEKDRLPIDLVAHQILSHSPDSFSVLWSQAQKMEFALHELPYLSMIKPYLIKTSTFRRTKKLLEKEDPAIVISSLSAAASLARIHKPVGYAFLPPIFNRDKWVAVLLYRPVDIAPPFVPFTRDLLTEFVRKEKMEPVATKALPLTLQVEGDYFTANSNITVTVSMLCTGQQTAAPASLTFNSNELDIRWDSEFITATATIGKGMWRTGKNNFQLIATGCNRVEATSFVADSAIAR